MPLVMCSEILQKEKKLTKKKKGENYIAIQGHAVRGNAEHA